MKHLILYGLVILLPLKAQSSLITRYKTNLGFYGGYSTDHRSVLYSNSDLEGWKNLDQLAMDGGLEEKALLCGLGSGAWIAYPEPNFQISADNGSNHAMLLLGDACIPADNINSVQAIGPINKEPIGLITFTETYFTSEALWVTNETSSTSGVKSFVCPAGLSGEWTVEGDGNKVCVIRPKDLIATGVCIFPDIPTQLNIQSATITAGCPDRETGGGGGNGTGNSTAQSDGVLQTDTDMDGTKVMLMQTCFGTFGAYKIVDNYFALPQLKAICDDSADDTHKFGFYKILDAWKFRMDLGRQWELNPTNIDDKRTNPSMPYILNILNSTFDIFDKTCPQIPDVYLNLMRYLFMGHLKSIWTEVPSVLSSGTDNKLSWKEANEYINNCTIDRSQDGVAKIPPSVACIERKRYGSERHSNWETDWNKKGWAEPALDLFLSGENLDHVMEHVWLVLNLVSPYCATVQRIKNNQWVDFTNLFRRNFLMPLIQQWLHPGPWQVLYDYMFSGFSIPKVKRMVITCVQSLLDAFYGYDPIDRPSARVAEFTNLSRKKFPVSPIELYKNIADGPFKAAKVPKLGTGGEPGKEMSEGGTPMKASAGGGTTKAPATTKGGTVATKAPGGATTKAAVATTKAGPTKAPKKKSRRKRSAQKTKKKPVHKAPSVQKLLKKEKLIREKERETLQHETQRENGGDKHGTVKQDAHGGGDAHGGENKHEGGENHDGNEKNEHSVEKSGEHNAERNKHGKQKGKRRKSHG